jgi:hypothetical protein
MWVAIFFFENTPSKMYQSYRKARQPVHRQKGYNSTPRQATNNTPSKKFGDKRFLAQHPTNNGEEM